MRMCMTKQKIILYVVNNVNFFLLHRLSLAIEARENGFFVHVAAPNECKTDVLKKHGFQFHKISMGRRTLAPWKEIKSIYSLYSLYKLVQPDLVHHLTIKPVVYGSLVARLLPRKPHIVNAITGMGYVFIREDTVSYFLYWVVMAIYRLAFRLKDHVVIFENIDDLTFFLRKHLVLEANAVLIRGVGVDTSQFSFLPEHSDPPIVMMASRLLWDKGIGEFIEAASILKGEGLRARFILVGDVDPGNPRTVTKKNVNAWLQSGLVDWWGHCHNMSEVLSKANVICLPSYREGVPRILIEASSCGRALISTDVPGCREIVKNGWNGILVPVKDGRKLADAIRKLVLDPDLRRKMGQRGREFVKSDFSEEIVLGKTLAVYEQSIAGFYVRT